MTAGDEWLSSGPYADVGDGFREEFRAQEIIPPERVMAGDWHTACNQFIVVTNKDGLVLTAAWEGCSCSPVWADAEEDDLEVAGTFEVLKERLAKWNDEGEFQILSDSQLATALFRLEELKLFS